jgi:hypothetical protein
VYDFHADEKPFEYNVKFTVALLRCTAPQILKCAWEEIVAFPSLESSATNPQFHGVRLMDVAEMARSHELLENLLTMITVWRICGPKKQAFAFIFHRLHKHKNPILLGHPWRHMCSVTPMRTIVYQRGR